jgi:hypothetical protein
MKWHMDLFLGVFGFHVDKCVGDPADPEKVWFKENLQLNRTDKPIVRDGGIFNHLAIKVKDGATVLRRLEEMGGKATEAGDNWIMMPTGLYLEVL